MTDFEQRLTELLDRKAAAADVSPEPDFLRRADVGATTTPLRPTRWSTPRLIGVAAAAVLIIGGIVLTLTVGRDAAPGADGGPSGPTEVYYQRVQVTLDAKLECANQIDDPGTFLSATIETYSDRTGRRWRSKITYPDGSTHEWIRLGSAIYPTQSAERGARHGGAVGCIMPDGTRWQLWGLAGDDFYSLDLIRELAPDEEPYVLPLASRGTKRIDGQTTSTGRAASVWRSSIDGTTSYTTGDPERPLQQTDEWYVDPADPQHIIERRFTQTIPGIGTLTSSEVLVADGQLSVPFDFFDTDGWTLHGATERPDLNGDNGGSSPATTGPSTTVAVSADQAQYLAVLTELGVDLSKAPKAALELGGATYCGWQQTGLPPDASPNLAGQQCIMDAHAKHASAVFVERLTTTEGDPIVLVFRTDNGTATMYADSTRDTFGSRQWDVVQCVSLEQTTEQNSKPPISQITCPAA